MISCGCFGGRVAEMMRFPKSDSSRCAKIPCAKIPRAKIRKKSSIDWSFLHKKARLPSITRNLIVTRSGILLVTFGYFWLLLVTFGYFWLLLVTFGYFWLLSVTFGYFRLLLVTFGYFWLLLVTFGYFWLLLITFGSTRRHSSWLRKRSDCLWFSNDVK
jgi:hypothetical protein